MLKNVTLTAEEALLRKARTRASAEHKTLNALFREWIARYARQGVSSQEYRGMMRRLTHIRTGRRFSRDEMNE